MCESGPKPQRVVRLAVYLVLLAAAAGLALQGASVQAQEAAPRSRLDEAERRAEERLRSPEPAAPAAAPRPAADAAEIPPMDLWEMTKAGGVFMIPIGLFSVLVVALAIERTIALRRGAILPRKLVQALKAAGQGETGLDPQQAIRICQKYPSSAATVIRTMMLKAHRSHSEIHEAVLEASQREADRLAGPVRWLTLTVSVAPMLGLLGTVQGMIQAFYRISHLSVGFNKAQVLASDIYVALVTTFAGLVVAIPAAIVAHRFMGRIQHLFQEMDEIILVLESQVQRHQRLQGPDRAIEPPPVHSHSPSRQAREYDAPTIPSPFQANK